MTNTTVKTFNPYEIYEEIYGHDSLDVMTREDIGSDYYYHTLVKNVREAEKFNYHSDYWGYDEEYQENAVEFVREIKPYIGKKVGIECGDDEDLIVATIVGVLIDKQYNNHIKILIEDVEE